MATLDLQGDPGSGTTGGSTWNPWMAPFHDNAYWSPAGTKLTNQLAGSYQNGLPSQDTQWGDEHGNVWGYDATGQPTQISTSSWTPTSNTQTPTTDQPLPTTQTPGTMSWTNALGNANAAARGNKNINSALNSDQINYLMQRFGGTVGNDVTQAGLDPVLAYLNGWAPGQAGPFGSGSGGGGGTGGTGGPANTGVNGGSFGGTNVFNDPATSSYESLINQRIGQLQTPYTPPDFQPAIDYLRSYFQQLQGAPYSPWQMDTMQTQTLDPMERQRTAAKQQAIQRLSARGIDPSSGIAQQTLNDIDNSFNTIRSTAQSKFTTDAIHQSQQNAQQAAVLGPQISQLEQGNFNTQEGRLDQAVNLASIIPTLSWNRLQSTQTPSMDPSSLLSLLNTFQGQGYNQGSQFTSGLTSILPYLLQLFS